MTGLWSVGRLLRAGQTLELCESRGPRGCGMWPLLPGGLLVLLFPRAGGAPLRPCIAGAERVTAPASVSLGQGAHLPPEQPAWSEESYNQLQ